MASPNSTYTEIVTSTLAHRSGEIADNVSVNVALLDRLKKKGNITLIPGGRTIVQELEYAENSTFMRYSGYEQLNIAASDVFSAAEFNWKQAATAVTMSGLEGLQNTGSDRVFALLKNRIKNAERTMANNIGADVYSTGTASDSKQIGGLQLIVADDPTSGTVGGISRSTYSFWRNKIFDISSAGGSGTASSSTIQGHMFSLYSQLTRNNDAPDLMVADNVYYGAYLASLQTIQRITDDKMASAGFISLKYMKSDVVLDGGAGGNCPASHMYMLNTNYLHFVSHSDRNFVPIGGERFSTNQDASVSLLGWAGNMTCANCALQGVMFH